MANEINPSVRINILDSLMLKLYTSSNNHCKNRLHNLIKINSSIYKNNQQCFSFRRTVFQHAEHTGPYPSPINILAPAMRGEMKEYIQDVQRTEAERVLVKGYLQKVVGISHYMADYLAVTPTALHPPIKKFSDQCEIGEGTLTPSEIEAFIDNNSKYLDMVRTRLTMNLINAP